MIYDDEVKEIEKLLKSVEDEEIKKIIIAKIKNIRGKKVVVYTN